MLVSASELRIIADWLLGGDPLRAGGRSAGYRWRSRVLEKLGPDFDIGRSPPQGADLTSIAQVVIKAVDSLNVQSNQRRPVHWHIAAHVEENFRWWGNKSWPPEIFVSPKLRPTRHKPVTFATLADATAAIEHSSHTMMAGFGGRAIDIFEAWSCDCGIGAEAVKSMPKAGPPRPSGRAVPVSLTGERHFVGNERQKLEFERAVGALIDGISDFVHEHGLLEFFTPSEIAEALMSPEFCTLKQLELARTCLGGLPRTLAFNVSIGENDNKVSEFSYDFSKYVISMPSSN